jgi:hypothetical protein
MKHDHDELLPVVRAAHLDEANEKPPWLVEGLWARAGVGILGGAPKCCKSWLALDMALSIASNTSCLDTFAVHDAGPVMLYMAEDAAPIVKSRLLGICRHRRMKLDELPIDVITAASLRIDRERDQLRLVRTVRHVKPRLLVLDPFVRLHRVDENDAGAVSGVLGYLRTLQRELDVAVLVVHHARKNGASNGQAGQSLRGSGDLHAWGDSNLYLRRQKNTLTLTIEHRAAAPPEPLTLHLVGSDEEKIAYLAIHDASPMAAVQSISDLDQAIVNAISSAGQPVGRTSLRDQLRVRNERLGEALTRLASRGDISRIGDRWAIPIPAPTGERERNGLA